ncbi:MAG: redox-regulated ATPase YchF [Candidatus Eremiobacteraeota bacterium]|nr:redox-regulated ATPase YchF [Candidatus Eremiobacteraeota bacterium]
MSLSIGIVGLPNAGKSTLFNAMTGKSALVSPHIFSTIEPNRGQVPIEDPLVDKLKPVYGAEKIIPADVTFVDVAGLIKGAHKGEGLGNRFLSHIREVDAIAMILRGFDDPGIPFSSGKLDPIDEVETLETELTLADLEVVEKAHEKRKRSVKLGEKKYKKEFIILDKILEKLKNGEPACNTELSENEKEIIKSFALLTLKPMFYIINISEKDIPGDDYPFREKLKSHAQKRGALVIPVCAKLEGELAQLEPDEAEMFAEELGLTIWGLPHVIKAAYDILDLITFYTGNEKEVRAWSLIRGSTAIEAAGKIHTDMAKSFIKAEVIKAQELVKIGSLHDIRDKGAMRFEGKDYVVGDRDVVFVRFGK